MFLEWRITEHICSREELVMSTPCQSVLSPMFAPAFSYVFLREKVQTCLRRCEVLGQQQTQKSTVGWDFRDHPVQIPK